MAQLHTAVTGLAEVSAQPSLDRLAAVVASAAAVEPAMRQAMGWLTWRLLGRVGAVAVGSLVLMVVARIGLEAWRDYELSLAQAQASLLQAEITGLKDTRDTLQQAGVKAVLNKCGPSARLCIRVDESAGAFGEPSDYRVIRGY